MFAAEGRHRSDVATCRCHLDAKRAILLRRYPECRGCHPHYLKDGKHRDGQRLLFEVKGGSRRWTFSYMFEGRQRELAIGKYPAMSLAEARAKRAELREAKDRGTDPKTVLAGAATATRTVTLRQDVQSFLAHMRGPWRPTHQKEWQQSVDRIAGPLMDMATANLTQGDLLNVITPAWTTTNTTARHVLGRIVNVLRHLPRVSTNVKPREAMPWWDLPAFFSELRQRKGPAARALENPDNPVNLGGSGFAGGDAD